MGANSSRREYLPLHVPTRTKGRLRRQALARGMPMDGAEA